MSSRNGQKSASEILASTGKASWSQTELQQLVAAMKPSDRAKLARALGRLEAKGLIQPGGGMAKALNVA